jgi:hypothetical protein
VIHEDEDEIENEPINFLWIYFICRNRLNLTDKESGRITLRQFLGLYQAYKDTFDLELLLRANKVTYQELKQKSEKAEEWF